MLRSKPLHFRHISIKIKYPHITIKIKFPHITITIKFLHVLSLIHDICTETSAVLT